MRLPILSYGHDILREQCQDIQNDEGLEKIIGDMWDTLYSANGCGLAAPQVNLPLRLFLVDSVQTYEHMSDEHRQRFFEGDQGIREIFINARITDTSEKTWKEGEGCLSIPDIHQPVERPWSLQLEYLNGDFEKVTRKFSGITARMIQHEFDHIEGVLFVDHLTPLTRLLLKGKLSKISTGRIRGIYPMEYME